MNILVMAFACSLNERNSKEENGEFNTTELKTDESNIVTDHSFESAQNCKNCHPKHYEEWQMSSHAYAVQSPVFNAMAQKAYRDSAGNIGDFCSNCHAPTSPSQAESGALHTTERSMLSNEGITCDYCHTAIGHDGIIGNNHIVHDTTSGLKYGQYGGVQSAHKSERNDFIPSSQLCGSCHDVFMYPNILIDQVYSEYILSPSYEFGTECQDCHMSPTPGRTSQRPTEPIAVDPNGEETYEARERSIHRFIGPDYPLVDSFPYPDDIEASLEVQDDWHRKIQMLLRNSAHIANVQMEMVEENEVMLTVAIESLTPGHRVPTGLTSERQMWVEVILYNQENQILFESGILDSNSDLRDAHSEDVQRGILEKDEQLMNFQSKNIVMVQNHQTGTNSQYETIFPFQADQILRRSLEPMEKRDIQYFVPIPSSSTSLRAAVRLRFRNLPPYLLRSLQLDDLIPRLKIFEMDEKEHFFEIQ